MNKYRLSGWVFLIIIAYCTLGAGVYFTSLLLLQQGVLFDVPWFVDAQKKLYRAGMGHHANNWLAQPNCITYDPDLIYKPSTGSCEFDEIEFKTTLNFSHDGRYTGTKPAGTGIAVIGDSHAMGWGVNDHETFSARLQKLTGRPVYNLGVASYGTSREIIRLVKSGILEDVDTIIIQYCNNDYNENIMFDSSSREQLYEKVFNPPQASERSANNLLKQVVTGYWLTLKAPFSALADRLRRKNFTRHYQPFISVIHQHYNSLRDKHIVVFYSNPFGQRYRNYPAGRDARFPNVSFEDLDLERPDYYKLDSHPTPAGHQKVAERLFNLLQPAQ